MGRGIGDDVIRPLKNALDDLPVHVRQLGEMFRRHGQNQRRNNDGVVDIDTFDTTVTSRGRNSKTTYWDPETGRPMSEQGTILDDFGSSTRGDNATDVGNLGRTTDDGGHLGGHRFYGDTPDAGIVPQAANLNRGAWKTMENEWAAWANKGYQVDYNIDVYPPGAVRPDSFEVDYTVTNPATGDVVHRDWPSFWNESGESFDRVQRRNMPGI